MRGVGLGFVGFVFLAGSIAQGAGHAFNDRLSVLAPDQAFADEVLAQADFFRTQVAQEWLGAPLPPETARIAIHLRISADEDWGFTWPIDNPQRKLHRIWLKTSRAQALDGTLHHEISHAVFAIAYPGGLPAWADEGAASFQDSAKRIAARRQTVEGFARSGVWPDLQSVLQTPALAGDDLTGYAAAASLTEFLASRGGREKCLRFAMTGKAKGWDYALRESYLLHDVSELQTRWQSWVRQRYSVSAAEAVTR
jgi:hypothetical protein